MMNILQKNSAVKAVLLSALTAGALFVSTGTLQAGPPDGHAAHLKSAQAEAGPDNPAQATNAPLFSFSVLSDTHITSWDGEAQRRLRAAMADHAAIRPGSELMVLNGDLTGGDEADYRSLMNILDKQPHPPIHATMGNHDFYRMWRTPDGGMDLRKLQPDWSSRQAVEQFTRFFQYDKPYHELLLHGYRFLFLSGEAYRDVDPSIGEDAYLSQEQLNWLKEKLDAAAAAEKGKPVFVFLHQPLPHTLDGTDRERGVVQNQELRALLDAHPDVIFFSGHTHWNLQTTKQVKPMRFLTVGSSSIRQVLNSRNEPETGLYSQSLVVDVYPDRIVIQGREHSGKSWVSPAAVRPYP